MSKSFQVPETVPVASWVAGDANNVAKPKTLTFLEFATTVWLDDPQACVDAQGKSSLVKQNRWFGVIGKFERAKPGDWITLDDEDYVTLVKIVRSPTRIFPSIRTMQAGAPFSEIVLQAVDQIPPALTAVGAAQA
jgi:hypothetical protein